MRALVLAGTLALAAPSAFGEDFDALVELAKIKCPASGVIPSALARTKIIEAAKIPLTEEVITAFSTGSLGTLAGAGFDNDKPDVTDALFQATLLLFTDIDNSRIASEGYPVVVRINRTTQDQPEDVWADRFLNGDFAWVEFRCKVPEQSPPPPPPGPPPPPPSDIAVPPIVIAGSQADLPKSLKDRKFATLGLDSDDGDTTIRANFVVGLASQPLWNVGSFYQVNWSPYVEYNRKTSDDANKDINSVIVGAGLDYIVGPETFLVPMDTDIEWQTDDDGDASIWRVNHVATFKSFDFCRWPNTGEGFQSRCTFSIAADYVHVDDPGVNPKWAALQDFTRAGVDFEWVIGRDFGPVSLALSAGYQSRFDLSGDDTTAEMRELKLSLSPAKDPHFSFSAAYKNGKDLKTLADVDTFALEFGYRQ